MCPTRARRRRSKDVLGGRVSMMFSDLVLGLPHVKAGSLNALAVSRIKRSALVPELPTLDEAGVTGFDMDSWAGIFAPAGTPEPIVNLLNTELRKIIDSAEVKAHARQRGLRGVLELAQGARRLRQGPARQVGQDDQGRRHPAGVMAYLHVGCATTAFRCLMGLDRPQRRRAPLPRDHASARIGMLEQKRMLERVRCRLRSHRRCGS